MREKEVALSALSAKFSRLRETKKHEEELAARNKEVVTLKHVSTVVCWLVLLTCNQWGGSSPTHCICPWTGHYIHN